MRDPDGLLARAGVRGDPDRDQHFLVDDRVLDRLPGYLADGRADPGDGRSAADASDGRSIVDGDAANAGHVLEIGAGTGALTDRLLAVADRVTAIERDRRLVAFLRREFAAEIDDGRLSIVAGDALAVDLPAFDASVSNLPYGVSSELAFRLLPENRPIVATFQREFAERMVADPDTPEYGRLSVSAQHFAGIEIVEIVPPEAFSPPPAVESAVVRTTPREPAYAVEDEAFFLRFVKALFTQRRKTMRNAIRNTAHISGLGAPDRVVEAADEELLGRRAGAVTPAEFAELATLALSVGEPGGGDGG